MEWLACFFFGFFFFGKETWPIAGVTGARSLVAGLPSIGHPSPFLCSLSFSASVAFSVAT